MNKTYKIISKKLLIFTVVVIFANVWVYNKCMAICLQILVNSEEAFGGRQSEITYGLQKCSGLGQVERERDREGRWVGEKQEDERVE